MHAVKICMLNDDDNLATIDKLVSNPLDAIVDAKLIILFGPCISNKVGNFAI